MNCEKCGAAIEDNGPAMILEVPDVDDLAFCLDSVACAEAGAETATIAARREAAGIKPDSEKPSGDSE